MIRFLSAAMLMVAAMPSCGQARTTVSYFSEAIIVTTDERHVGSIDTPANVGRAIEGCWHPPHAGDQITVRLSFRRDGSVFGKPFVTFRRTSSATAGSAAQLDTSISEAVARCAPLPFTPLLGAEIAGQVFLIRFIAPPG